MRSRAPAPRLMLEYTLRRIVLFVPVILGVLVIVFLAVRLVPGDPAVIYVGPEGTLEDRARITRTLGLDRSLPVQFGIYAWRAVQGDFGRSIFLRTEVSTLIRNTFPATSNSPLWRSCSPPCSRSRWACSRP